MLRVATGSYAHLRALIDGGKLDVGDRAVPLDWEVVRPGAIFRRALDPDFPYDIAEMSLSTVYLLADRSDHRFAALPLFPSRMFRHGAIYARGERGKGGDLDGARIGTVRLSQTATVWAVELLHRHLGVRREALRWRVAEPPPVSPAGLEMEVVGGDLSDLHQRLLGDELDLLISVRVPPGLEDGRIRRALPDFRALERAAFEDEGFVPPMHTLVARRAAVERYPELPAALFAAVERSTRAAMAWLEDEDASALPVPFQHEWLEQASRVCGGEPWPAGLASNRRALERFAGLMHAQGFLSRPLPPEEVFLDLP